MLITDVLDFLEDLNLVGGATGWRRAAGFLPPSPDRVIAVFETTGLEPELVRVGSTEQAYDNPGFQVRGRGAEWGYADLRDRMGKIYRALHGSELAPATGAPAYVYVHAVQSGPLTLGLDDSNRPGMTWNFIAMREREE